MSLLPNTCAKPLHKPLVDKHLLMDKGENRRTDTQDRRSIKNIDRWLDGYLELDKEEVIGGKIMKVNPMTKKKEKNE